MLRFAAVSVLLASTVGLSAAPVPSLPDARALVVGLSSPSEDARNAATADLRGRVDARPWLRRASRSTDKDTVRRASALLSPVDTKRQEAVPKMLDGCILAGQADLFIEWHHFWQPKSKDELWPVGPRMGNAAVGEFGKRWPEAKVNYLEEGLGSVYFPGHVARFHDGTQPEQLNSNPWHLRTDCLQVGGDALIAFASVAGPAQVSWLRTGHYFVLGPVGSYQIIHAVAVCADGLFGIPQSERPGGLKISGSFVVCRGDVVIPDATISHSILLVDGDIDMSRSAEITNSLIRATGRIHLPKNYKPLAKDGKPANCTIEAHAKNATAPYKFFELSDVGLSLADDEEGLVVTAVKADTPFGNCGMAKGDLIRAIDDVPAGHSEEFRKAVRRALVRQGDCLLTVTRGDKNHDLPVFFPLPK